MFYEQLKNSNYWSIWSCCRYPDPINLEIRFDTEQAAQHSVDCDIPLNGKSFAFRRNAQRRLRVSIHEVHPNVPDAALQYELMQYFGGVLEIKRDTRHQTNSR